MSPLVLALDLASSTGWALGRWGEEPRHGSWSLYTAAGWPVGSRLSSLASALETAFNDWRPDAIVFEAPLPQQKRDTQQTARLLIGLAAVAEMIACEHKIPITEEFPNVARKLVLGTASVDKDGIMHWCQSNGWRPVSHDAADALVLLRYRLIMSRARRMA